MPRLKNKKVSAKYQMIATDASGQTGLPKIKLNLRLYHGENIAMGPGKADLLEAIERTGSISAAGKSMDMSYRRAWLLVDEMNRCFKSPVVATAKGGSHGGGAHVTPFGHEVLARYQEMITATRQVAAAYLGLFRDMMHEKVPEPEAAPPPAGDH